MRRIATFFAATALAVTAFAPAALGAGPGDCEYGETHKFLATSGLTGKAHIPGVEHRGASGFCELPNG